MKYIKAFLCWLVIIPLAILNGGIRNYVTAPWLGSRIALPLSGIILSPLIVAAAYFMIPKIGKSKPVEYLAIGVMWFILSNLFDLLMTLLEKKPVSEFWGLFDITTGNLWIIVVVVCLISPVVTAKIRKLI